MRSGGGAEEAKLFAEFEASLIATTSTNGSDQGVGGSSQDGLVEAGVGGSWYESADGGLI